MFVLNLVFLAFLATSAAQPGISRYIRGRWVVTDENLQYENAPGLTVEEGIWPASPPVQLVTKDQNLLTTPEPYAMKEQDSDKGEESAVWKIVLVAAILLVSVVGSMSMAYYMCVWRGGRIHYQPHKFQHYWECQSP